MKRFFVIFGCLLLVLLSVPGCTSEGGGPSILDRLTLLEKSNSDLKSKITLLESTNPNASEISGIKSELETTKKSLIELNDRTLSSSEKQQITSAISKVNSLELKVNSLETKLNGYPTWMEMQELINGEGDDDDDGDSSSGMMSISRTVSGVINETGEYTINLILDNRDNNSKVEDIYLKLILSCSQAFPLNEGNTWLWTENGPSYPQWVTSFIKVPSTTNVRRVEAITLESITVPAKQKVTYSVLFNLQYANPSDTSLWNVQFLITEEGY